MGRSITLKDKLYEDLQSFCKLNGIKINDFCNQAILSELNRRKFGDIPFGVISDDKTNEQKNEQISEQISERINDDLPKELVDDSKIPSKPIANEIIEITEPWPEPDEKSSLVIFDEKKEEKNENKEKNKKRRL